MLAPFWKADSQEWLKTFSFTDLQSKLNHSKHPNASAPNLPWHLEMGQGVLGTSPVGRQHMALPQMQTQPIPGAAVWQYQVLWSFCPQLRLALFMEHTLTALKTTPLV